MVTTWPKNFPGLGVGAQRLADRITAMSDGRLTIEVYSAGELVPAARHLRRGHRRLRRDEPRRRLLLAEQEPGHVVLHRRPLRHDSRASSPAGCATWAARSSGTRSTSSSGSRLPARRHRHPGRRLVRQGADRRRRPPGPEVPHPGPRRPGLGKDRRQRRQHGRRRDFRVAAVRHARRRRVRRPLQRPRPRLLPDCQELRLPELHRAGARHRARRQQGEVPGTAPDLQAIVQIACQAEYDQVACDFHANDPLALDILVNEHGVISPPVPRRHPAGRRRRRPARSSKASATSTTP